MMTETWPPHPYPRDERRREAKRIQMYEEALLIASHKATKLGLSYRCAHGDHGCQNSGTGCMCRCHDKKETK